MSLTTPPSPPEKQIQIIVRGTPRPKQSGRWVGRRMVSVVKTNKLLKAWTQGVINAARECDVEPWLSAGALVIDTFYVFKVKDPKRWGQPHITTPDRDNLDKAVFDALTHSGLIPDDKRCSKGTSEKMYGAEAGCRITIRPVGFVPLRESEADDIPEWMRTHALPEQGS